MKRHLLLFSVLFILLIGCKEEQITKFVTITDKSYSLPSEGGVFDVMLMGNGEYSIETSPANLDWILESESNSSEPEKIIFNVKPNFSPSKRSATVIIKTASNDISVYVEQYPGPPAIVNSSISKFKFSVDDNKMQIINDIEFKIEDNRITGRIPYYTKLESLIARFETNASMVKVGETIQISGVTANNFVEPVEYTVLHEDGSEETYTVEVTNFTGLPVLFIYTDNKEPIASKDNYVNGTIFFDGAGEFENLTAPMRIKGRGNSTWSMPKKPYRIKFDEKQSMAGFPANKDWVLLANYADKTSLRTEVAFNISRNTSLEYTPRTQHVEVFINDVYNGTYVLTEQLKIRERQD